MILLSRVALKLLYNLQRLCVNTENLRSFFCKSGFMDRFSIRLWETDRILGGCGGREALLAIAERKSRFPCLRKVKDKKSSSIMEALRSIQEEFGASFEELFETITTDNGTEFSRLPKLEEGRRLRIYYAHPYCPSDKEMIENMNHIIRGSIPKEKR